MQEHLLKRYFAFCQNPKLLKDQSLKKYQHYIDVREDKLPTPRGVGSLSSHTSISAVATSK